MSYVALCPYVVTPLFRHVGHFFAVTVFRPGQYASVRHAAFPSREALFRGHCFSVRSVCVRPAATFSRSSLFFGPVSPQLQYVYVVASVVVVCTAVGRCMVVVYLMKWHRCMYVCCMYVASAGPCFSARSTLCTPLFSRGTFLVAPNGRGFART